MTSTLRIDPLSVDDRAEYGQARVRDQAFDAVQKLWRRRRDAGWKQTDLAAKLGWDPAVVSKKLSGPANWTFRTFGALVDALDGEVEIEAFDKEEAVHDQTNLRAYDDFASSATLTLDWGKVNRGPSKEENSRRRPSIIVKPYSYDSDSGESVSVIVAQK